ncbi:Gfo/Idh/MocA family protein [Desulfofustis glycolicus]|uniref:Predicted dehydrogenase n=1 Tax=Desulfofustis glycolicus DSM 9705 TaxID=1121409 RepID=A0A1M5Y6X1_9BACT|nr:Gfo/Idh/MocA family oxidoreductase [Desulfofustis glycolicus]MCB2216859.1 Gfo/Idh/MocA family oxidoreductase [Desulfobulbaceae bacterium]SHI07716.1 Predicted dehydrogenase [Desulfofustis glycolicus DSM 9705]
MVSVRIFGAGSIGNHLSFACRQKGWQVEMCDRDKTALERTQKDIYPGRYGKWDADIQLQLVEDLADEYRDVVIIGTPPEYHIPVALDQIRRISPKIVLIEKPLCPPSLDGVGELLETAREHKCLVLVGYNHTLTRNTRVAEQLLADRVVGEIVTIDAGFREYWGGIFAAHPWLDGPKDSYLGYLSKGGGATGEHSHAINIWQHFAHITGNGRTTKVAAMHQIIRSDGVEYDQLGQMIVETESGLIGNIVQDVVTEPPEKKVKIIGKSGYIEWQVNATSDCDAVRYKTGDIPVQEQLFKKTRPDDFAGEIDHLADLLADPDQDSPISLTRGLETMLIIEAAYKSSKESRFVTVDYSRFPFAFFS